jgi:hypothetical protein
MPALGHDPPVLPALPHALCLCGYPLCLAAGWAFDAKPNGVKLFTLLIDSEVVLHLADDGAFAVNDADGGPGGLPAVSFSVRQRSGRFTRSGSCIRYRTADNMS